MRFVARVGFVAALAAACSSAPSVSAPTKTGFAFDVSASVAASQERYVCELVQVPGTGDVFVHGGSYRASPGVHHYLLFRTSFTSPPPSLGVPVDCFAGEGVMKDERGFVSGGAKAEDGWTFLPGQALPFHGGDVLLLQVHLLDAQAAALQASLHVELDTVTSDAVTTRVGTLRFYDPYIVLPPHASSRATMRCPLEHDVTLLGAGSHMHARGVGYRAFADRAGEPRATAPFYTTSSWETPPYWYGPMPLAAGSAIRFECDYQNGGDTEIVQGLSATANEMCMFSAFYAPASEDSAQQEREEDCTAMSELGTGDRSCAQTTSCLELCAPSDAPHFETGDPTVGACWQECIAASCPNAAGALLPQLECTKAQCADACAAFGAGCSACVQEKCRAQLDACQALACDGG